MDTDANRTAVVAIPAIAIDEQPADKTKKNPLDV